MKTLYLVCVQWPIKSMDFHKEFQLATDKGLAKRIKEHWEAMNYDVTVFECKEIEV